ncbi:putative sporulation protein YtxC [Croceifilum oryzae]|uniref:Sporulation protein YtxC n=1 Tax=Croceifilum oryzae TaxID=1553429 RepID=A0AAJ1TLB0_9BACL|nr:putative sporulation protein YtxC [Croceifilum oryzae]MDQ0416776.1 putative sporulation protein YtxC [Croceifilum oryzae]
MDKERSGTLDYSISISRRDPIQLAFLRDRFGNMIMKLKKIGVNASFVEEPTGELHFFKIHTQRKRRLQDKEVHREMGDAIASFLCDFAETDLIRGIIQKEHTNIKLDEMDQIEFRAQQLLERNSWSYLRTGYHVRKERISKQIAMYLDSNRVLSIDGFVRFRLKAYRKSLVRCVKDAYEEYQLDKEYRDFIELLRYFVSVQSPKVELIHVVHRGSKQFQLLKEDGTPYQLRELDGAVQELMDQSLSHEDLVVSSLLSIAPEKLVLHTKQQEENVIRTLLQIFEGRVVVCHDCQHCHVKSIPVQEDA